MYIFLPLLYYIGSSLLITIICKKKIGYALPIAMMLSPMILYTSQYIIGSYWPGFCFLMMIGVAGYVLFFKRIYNNHKNIKNNDYQLGSLIISPGLVVFVAVYVVNALVYYNRCFSVYDELSHWGMMVKEMMRLDRFFADASSNLVANRTYVPFAPINNMFWCMMSGMKYSESVVSLAQHVFELSLVVVPGLEVLNRRKEKVTLKNFCFSVIIAFSFAWLLCSFDPQNRFETIYVDFFFPMIYIYCSILVISRQAYTRFGLFSFVLGECTLVLSKDIAIVFLPLLMILFIGFFVWDSDEKEKKKQICLMGAILSIILPILFRISWNIYLGSSSATINSATLSFDMIDYQSIKDLVVGNGLTYQYETIKRFIIACFNVPLCTGGIKFSYFTITLIFSVVTAFLFYKKKEKKYIVLLTVNLIGAIGYALSILGTYVLLFAETDALNLEQFKRFMASYVVCEVVIGLYIVVAETKKIQDKNLMIRQFVALSILFVIVLDHSAIVKTMPQSIYGEPMKQYKEFAEQLQKKYQIGESVFIVANSPTFVYFPQYYANELHLNWDYIDFYKVDPSDSDYADGFLCALKSYNYMYIKDLTDDMRTFFLENFDISDMLTGNYRIIHNDRGTTLERIGE